MNDYGQFIIQMQLALDTIFDSIDGHTDDSTLIHIAFQIGVISQLLDEEKRRRNAIMEATNQDSQ